MKSSTNIVKLPHGSGLLAHDHTPSANSGSLVQRFVYIIDAMIRRSYRSCRSLFLHDATVSNLRCLDDRLLRDIGIERDQIELFVAKHTGSKHRES